MINNVIFDLDGTLVDSFDDIIHCLKKAFHASKIDSANAVHRDLIGLPLRDMIRLVRPDITKEQLNSVVSKFRDYYDNSSFAKTRLYEGVYELLNKLREIGTRNYIFTNKPKKPTARILTELKIHSFFSNIATPDIRPKATLNKTQMLLYLLNYEDLKRHTTLVVGDTASDVYAAHENDVLSVGILSGYGNNDEIKLSRPNYRLQKIADLYDLIITFEG